MASTIGRFLKKLRPYTIKKGLKYLKHYGVKEFFVRLSERIEPEEVPYEPWYEKHKASEETLKKQRDVKWKNPPVISVAVPVWNTPPAYLKEMVDSLLRQSYPYFELCVVNASPENREVSRILADYAAKDSRIRVIDVTENAGIGGNTNIALESVSGDYTGLLDHDDFLSPDALFEVAKAIKETGADVIYTDEDKVDEKGTTHFQPALKPDFSPDLLRSNNYICHFLVVKTSLVRMVGGLREGFEGAQDHDFLFRVTEKAEKIVHIPRILYHWRTHSASTADNPDSKLYAYESGVRAVEEHLARCGVKGTVSQTVDYGFYKVVYPVTGHPLVSIIIPNKDNAATLKKCLDSVFEKTTYDNYEIIIAENNSTEEETFRYYEELKKNPKVKVVTWNRPFNFSAINNYAVTFAKGDFLLFLNNDVEVLTCDWLEQFIGNTARPEVGITGCRLYYPDGTIQHAGVIIGIGGIAGHAFLNMKKEYTGYMHKAAIQLNYSAVTAACMMVKRSVFEEAGGFEEELTVAFNDVDFCLRVRQMGYYIVYDPYIELIHYESKTRGAEDTEEKVRRFQSEIEFMRTRWIDILKKGDPFYNPNLTLSKWNYSLKA